MKKFNLTFILILFFLSGCAYLNKAKVDPYEGMSQVELYNEGLGFLSNADIPQAVGVFEILEARFPFSTYAQQSVLDLAFAYYDFGQKDDAIAECDRFIDLYPNHSNLDYAYYLRAVSNLEKEQPFFQEFLGQDVSKYDVTRLKRAYDDLLFISNRFKDSKYADDATNRLIYLRNSMANHEVYIAKYYLKRGAFIASSERAKHMLETYPGAPATEEALKVLVASYNSLGSKDLAEDAARVLVSNYSSYSYNINKEDMVILLDLNNKETAETDDSFFGLGLF